MRTRQYDTLGDDAVTELAQRALRNYPQEVRGVPRLLCRSENSTFLVQASGGRYALRVHRGNYHTRENIDGELRWLDALREDTGLVVPQAVRDCQGGEIQTLRLSDGSSRNAVLFHWIEGEMPTLGVDPKAFRQLGEVTARLHQHSKSWKKPQGFCRIVWNHETMVGPRSHWGDWRDAQGLRGQDIPVVEAAVARVGENLAAYGQSAGRYGLIHADLRLANLLLHKEGTRVIDFDDCGMGWFIHDLAAALSFAEHCPQAETWVENWLRGYERAGHLDDCDLAMVPSMLMQRRIQMTAWVATHADTETAQSLGPHWVEHTVRLCGRYLEGGMPLGEA